MLIKFIATEIYERLQIFPICQITLESSDVVSFVSKPTICFLCYSLSSGKITKLREPYQRYSIKSKIPSELPHNLHP